MRNLTLTWRWKLNYFKWLLCIFIKSRDSLNWHECHLELLSWVKFRNDDLFTVIWDAVTIPFLEACCRPDVSELEAKLAEQSKILLNLQQKVDDLASKVPNSKFVGSFMFLVMASLWIGCIRTVQLFKPFLCFSLPKDPLERSTIHSIIFDFHFACGYSIEFWFL